MGGGRRVGLEPETHTGCGFCARGRRPSADRLWDLAVALVCPDKFRGTLTAAGAAEALARGREAAEIDRWRFDEVRRLPLADGGEGTLDALMASQGGSRRRATVTGPLGDPVEAEWGVLPDGTAVVESAGASGLALLSGPNDPLAATSRGTGELIRAAVRGGARRIVVAVGGSAMTDGGLGAVDALAWSLKGLDVVVACDVTTPFLGARLEPGFEVVARAAGFEAALDGVDLVLT